MGMKCEVDNCDNEATVHLTEIREGKKHEMHLCERCASEKGLPGKSHFSISDLLHGIASQAQAQAQKSKRTREAACPVCGATLSQFQSSGRFGCPECYTTFKDDVQGLVEKIHDSSQHVGKVPRRISSEISLQKDIRQLQLDLKKAIKREDYEKAAAIRDQIHQLEEQIKQREAAQSAQAVPQPRAEPKAEPRAEEGNPGHKPSGKKKGHSEGEGK
jgi:protein arginine kinase activator